MHSETPRAESPSPGYAAAPLRLLIVEDHPGIMKSLLRLISGRFGPHVRVLAAASPEEALQLLPLIHPQTVVLDVDLGGADGLALMPELVPHCRVVVLTSQGDRWTRARARELGACAFIDKTEPASALLACLSTIASTEMQGEHPPGISGDSSAVERPSIL